MKESDIRDQDIFDEYIRLVTKDIKNFFEPSLFDLINCPACGGGYKDLKNEFEKNGFTFVTCKKCGTLFTNPRPTVEQINQFYAKSDSGKFFTEHFFMPFAEARREKIFQPRVKRIIKMFPQYSKGRIGDIGAGHGIFLEELQKKWSEADLIAIEPSQDMIKICNEKKLHTINKMFEDIEIMEEERFDLLCSFELFEHLCGPKTFLEKCNSVLKPNGHLFMTTLSGKGFDIQILWKHHKNVNPPVHLNFFNPGSVQILLERCGFSIVEITTPGKLDWDIVESSSKRGESKLDRFWNQVINAEEGTKNELQDWISRNRFSSHMQIVAKKISELPYTEKFC
jgi:SAM-dependent methyltransferase